MAFDDSGDTEVDEGQPLGFATLDVVEGREPRVQIELRRWRGRQHRSVRLNADARGIAGEQRAIRIEIAHVMTRVARRRKTVETEDTFVHDAHVLLRNGNELAPEVVEAVAIEPARARFQSRRIDEVRRT